MARAAVLQHKPAARSAPIQAKLNVGPVGDRFEQEADRVASRIGSWRHRKVAGVQGPAAPCEDPLRRPSRLAVRQPFRSGARSDGSAVRPPCMS